MISGRQTLAILDDGLQRLRERMEGFETRLEESGNRLVTLRRQESEIYRKLAELRAETLETSGFQQRLDEAERHASRLLARRKEAMQALAGRTRESRERQTALERARQAQAEKVSAAAQALQARLDDIHEKLREQADYQARQQAAQEAVDTLAAAEEKTRRAEEEYENKGQPYRDDPLFLYLWNARYGTSGYRANPVIRFFDGLLARHIRYEAARQNYNMLSEIPRRLREHTEKLRARAESEMKALSAMEEAAERAGGADALEQALEAEKAKLQALDEDIGKEEQRYAGLLAEHETYAAGKDDDLKQAIHRLAESFRTDPIPQLRQEAARTLGYEDDSLVSQLADLRLRKAALEKDLEDNRRLHAGQSARLHDLEALRRRFKQYDYDASNSRFDDETALRDRMDDFLQGILDADQLWDQLQRSQRFVRYRNYPSRGGAGFPPGFGFPGGIEFPADMRIPRGVHIPGGLGDLVGGVLGGILSGGGMGFPGGGGLDGGLGGGLGGGGLGGGDILGGGPGGNGGGGGGFHTGGGF